jgi:hypothetical protein
VALLDDRLSWHLGPNRRKLQILALGFLASLAAPLSWFVLGKAHSFVHTHIDMVLWYVPTIPLGCAVVGLSLAQTIENRALWKVDAARSWITAAIPIVVIGSAVAIYFADRTIQTQGTWVIPAHENGVPLFKSDELGVDFRMTDQWFIVRYQCRIVNAGETFFVRTGEGASTAKYDFRLADNQVFAQKGTCISAQAKSDQRFGKIDFGQMAGQRVIWQRSAEIKLPETFHPEDLNTTTDWNHGISRSSGTELLVPEAEFAQLFIRVGDRLQFDTADQHRITKISPLGFSRLVAFEGPPVKLPDGTIPLVRIIRE